MSKQAIKSTSEEISAHQHRRCCQRKTKQDSILLIGALALFFALDHFGLILGG